MPSSFFLKQMEVLCDLSELITSSELFQQSCSSVTTIQAAFSDDHSLFAVSVEAAIFFFSMTCNDHEAMIQFQGSFTCNTVITSLCWLNDELVLGTASGGLLSIVPHILDTSKVVTQPSDTMEIQDEESSYQSDPKTSQEEMTSLQFRLQGGEMHSLWSLVLTPLESARGSANVEILWNISSIHEIEMPLQPSIQWIQQVGKCLLVSDGVRIVWIDTKNGELIRQWFFDVTEGVAFCTAISETPLIQCITKQFHYQVIDLAQSQILVNYSIPSDFARYSDVIYLGSASFQTSAILVASQVITSQRTTSIDMTRQLLVLKSYGLMNTEWLPSTVVLTQQMARESFATIWEQIPAASTQELQCVHIYVSVMMRQGKPWWFGSQTDAVDKLLTLRRRLWLEALRSRSDAGSRWICRQLEGSSEEPLDEWTECECCGEKTFLHRNHASWCLLSSIDDYCPLSFQPIPTGEVLVCPCCYIAYLQGEECVFCSLRLIRVLQYQHANTISRRRINEYRCNSCMVDWNILYSCLFNKPINMICLKESSSCVYLDVPVELLKHNLWMY